MNARELIERLIGPPAELVDELVWIINRARTWQEANESLSAYGIAFTTTNPDLNRTGAVGGCNHEDTLIYLNATYFGRRMDWHTVLAHELTHRDQLERLHATGKDVNAIYAKKEKRYYDKEGYVRPEVYLNDPAELQALARNAVDSAVKQGKDVHQLLRRGHLGRYSPIPPGDAKRFGKYAHQFIGARAG